MSVFNISQNFNNSAKRSFMSIDTDAATAEILVAMMPDGVTSFSPDGSGVSGTARAVPTQYVTALAICKDSSNPTAKPSYVGINYGKATLSDDDIVAQLKDVVKLTNGTTCDSVRLKSYDLIGATAPAV